MKIYGCPNTRSVRAVWALEEAGASYDYELIDLRKGAAQTPAFLGVNPGGKLPALRDGELTLTESGAICIYIADKYPHANLIPALASHARARFHQWCFFALSELEQPLWTIAKHRFALPEAQRVAAIMDTARWEFARAANVLAAGLGEREFIVGEQFSVADILIAHSLAWARLNKLELGAATLDAYADRMMARPACARAMAREKLAMAS